MTVLSCEHDEETEMAEASVRGGVVRWTCAQGHEHECGAGEI